MSSDSERTALCKLLHPSSALPPETDWEPLIAQANRERVTPLLYSQLKSNPSTWSKVPLSSQQGLQNTNVLLAAREVLRHKEAQSLLQVLNDAGLHPITIKGAALAYTLYEVPHHRPRMDTDLLFANKADADKASGILISHGYTRLPLHEGDLISKAITMSRVDDSKILEHQFDLHWRVAYEHRYRAILDYQLLIPTTRTTQAGYRVADPITNLLITCLHCESERPNQSHNRLIWYNDVKLLLDQFKQEDWENLEQRVLQLGMGDAMADLLTGASHCLQFELPNKALTLFKHSGGHARVVSRHDLTMLLRNLKYLPTRDKPRYLWQLLVPPPETIRTEYGGNSTASLLLGYIKRFASRLGQYLQNK